MRTNMLKLAASLLALVISGAVCGADAWSSNTHAHVRVTANSTNVLIAVPWTAYTKDGSESEPLPITKLVRAENLDDGDMLMSVKHGNTYESWMLRKDEAGVGTWQAAVSVQESGAKSSAKGGKSYISSTPANAQLPVERGIGLWLLRQVPKDEKGSWKPFYLYGQYAKGSAKVSIEGVSSDAEAVMVANPVCTRALSLNGDITWSNVAAGDTLSIPNGSDAWDLCIWDANKGQWYVSKTERVGRGVKTTRNYALTIPAGHGFWYIRRAKGKVTIEFAGN